MLLYFVNLIFYTGVACTLFGFVFRFKFFEQWRLIIQVVGVIALGAGLYMKGGYEVEIEWRNRVAEMEAKLKQAEEKSAKVNTVIETKVVTKVKHIKDVQVKLQKEIVEREKIINGECTVSPEAIELLNRAAERPVAGENK
jgi:preprotein translocase subunit SecF